MTKPTITALNGNIGEVLFAMSLVCDFRYATPNTIINLPAVKFGLPTAGVLSFYLIHHLGRPRSIDIP
jgi:enoyl-CoA hydratase/carnithine racemase